MSPVESLKAMISTDKAIIVGEWILYPAHELKYDVRKTDSLVTPLVASVSCGVDHSKEQWFRHGAVEVALDYQDEKWSPTTVVITTNHWLNGETRREKIDERTIDEIVKKLFAGQQHEVAR